MTDSKHLSLSWEPYEKSMCSGMRLLQQKGEFVDMTLAADGNHVKVHQMVMSLVSPFIKELIESASCPHPVLFLNRITCDTLQSILEYAYTGEVVIASESLSSFLEACKQLQIKGLEEFSLHGNSMDLLHAIESNDGENPDPVEPSDTPLDTDFKPGIKRKRPPKVDYDAIDYSLDNELENHYAEIEPYKAGSRWFCRGEYYYVVYRTKGPSTYLRCTSDKCPAHWKLSKKRGSGPVVGTHNHAPTPWVPNRNAMFQELKRRTTSESLPFISIYKDVAIRYHDAALRLPFASVVPSMRKWRQNAQLRNSRRLQSSG